MKILCEYTPSGPAYVRSGWGRVFFACGHDFRFWEPAGKSAHDAFAELAPDILISCTYSVDRALVKCIKAHPNMRVILFASAWGGLVDNIDRDKYPIVIASEEEKRVIAQLKAATGRPDYVFIHVTNKYLEGTMGGWRTIGVKPVGILNAADTFLYLNGVYKPELRSDVSFIGGYWGYKARNLDKYLLPLCHPSSGLSMKIFGNRPWPVSNYLGVLDDQDAKDVFASATVCPNVSEPHSTAPELGFDTIERPFKVLSSGGFCVSDYVDEAREIFTEEELPMARTPEEFHKLVRHFVTLPKERDPFMAAGRRKVLLEHTYFDRVAQMFDELGMEKEAAKVLATKGAALAGRI